MRKILLTFIILLTSLKLVNAQRNALFISGKVFTEDFKPLAYATVRVIETGQATTTSIEGKFSIPNISNYKQALRIEISHVGRKTITLSLNLVGQNLDVGIIYLPVLSLSLSDITVSAKRDYRAQSNSSVVIDRDIIEQTPALSINDILNLLPNKKNNTTIASAGAKSNP